MLSTSKPEAQLILASAAICSEAPLIASERALQAGETRPHFAPIQAYLMQIEERLRQLASLMMKGTFEEGYGDGWASVAGEAPLPKCPTCPPREEWAGKTAFQLGFEYGRARCARAVQPDF